mgnify:CR=1 FL=1
MIIKKIKLENIRSYTNQELELPQGSTLLAGDIGSGKSSILLAIDFALFGLRKGNLSGASLLRNGTNEGEVELNFNIENKDVVIKRSLKRNHDSVTQDTGFIIINNEKKERSAIELKQDILDLLNYPKELLTKSKSLIYRYTVYTPQEEMKSILLGDKDIRLDTLRKVFDIDKYKRIKENSKIYTQYLKQKRKELEGKIYDLEDKKRELQNKIKEHSNLDDNIKEIIPKINDINKDVDKKREEIKLSENEVNKLKELKKEIEINKVKLDNILENYENNSKEIENLILTINKLEKDTKLELLDIEEVNNKIKDFNDKIKSYENELEQVNKKLNEFETKKLQSTELKSKILELKECPLCKQNVTHEHKTQIKDTENYKIQNYDKEIMNYKNKKFSLQDSLNDFKNNLEKLREEKANYDLIKLKIDNLKEKKQRKNLLLKEQTRLSEDINSLKEKINGLNFRIKEYDETKFERLKKELEDLQKKERNLELERATYLANLNELNKIIDNLNQEISYKLAVKNNINNLANIQNWLEEYFENIVNVIEKQIMLRVYNDFNSLFQKWFNMLMEIENIQVNLDEEFTPIIEQNGHDLDFIYLSGGEKTATALAYRLALNQVINNLMTNIKTRDLLILDEPTDGFSDEQLDRVRNVLGELNLKQLILVSHEPKIESFVDYVIRLNKQQHITRVI